MPKVPQYQRQVQLDKAPVMSARYSANANASNFGGVQASQLGDVADALGSVAKATSAYDRYRDRQDATLARDKKNEVETNIFQYFESDIYNRSGKNAFNTAEDADKYMDELSRDASKNSENDNQKEYFKASFSDMTKSYMARALSHQEDQKRQYEVATLDAENQTSVDVAVSNKDADAIKNMVETITANTSYKYAGSSKDVVNSKIAEELNLAHTEVLRSIAKDSPQSAREYLKTHWDSFNPVLRDKLRGEVESMAEVQDLKDKAADLSALSLDDALAEADKIKDPDKSAKLKRMLKDNYAEKNMLEDMKAKKIFEGEVDKVFKDPFGYKLPLDLSAKDQEHLYNLQKKMRGEQLGGAQTDNLVLYSKLKAMSPDEFKKTDLTKYISQFKGSTMKQLMDEQRKGTRSFHVVRPYQQAQIAIKGLSEFNVKKKGDEASARTNKFIGALRERLDSIPEAERTEDMVNNIIYKDLLKPVSYGTNDWIPFNEKTIYNFELSSVEDEKERTKFMTSKESIPQSLQGYSNVNYDSKSNVYYVDGPGVRRIYDSAGKLIKTFHSTSFAKE